MSTSHKIRVKRALVPRSCPILIALLFFFCKNNLTTQELLDGNFLAKGQTPIDLLSPTENQQVTTANPTLSWSSRGAGLYVVQMATDAYFANTVLNKEVSGTSYTVANADLIGVSSLPTASYYWRIKVARIANHLQSKTGSFFLVSIPTGASGFAGVLYVDTNSANSVQLGSVEAPYKKIQAAISAADALRNSNKDISFQIRVAKGTYAEILALIPGISIFGGYSSADWTRNLATNVTAITATQTTTIIADASITVNYTATTVIDGFTITGGAVNGASNYAFYVTGSPKITNNTILGSTGGGSASYGVYTNFADPVITGNDITGSTGFGNAYGIYASYNSVTISNNIIRGGTNGLTHGVYLYAGSAVVSNNAIHGGTGSNSYGIYIDTSSPVINNNTIASAAAAATFGVYSTNTCSPQFSNNIVFTSVAANHYAYYENQNYGSPTTFNTNLLFDSPAALYSDCTASAGSCTTRVNLFDQNCGTTALDFGSGAACSMGGAVNPVGGAGAGTGNRSTNAGTTAVFTAGYSITNPKTWIILGSGPADVDSSGGWTTGDIGADISKVGPQ